MPGEEIWPVPDDERHPVDPAVRARIMDTLDRVERDHDVRILFACESGSRGWGFASPDSDYDVRFLYAGRLEEYLRVSARRDVIELPVDATYDVSGWDLRKALGLLGRGNATLFEWLHSPIRYRADEQFVAELVAAMETVHRPDRTYHHYLHMARKHLRSVVGVEQVKFKRYFYTLRPLLAASWIQQHGTRAPMVFEDLMDRQVAEPVVLSAIRELLQRKRRAGEAEFTAPVPVIEDFLVRELAAVEASAPHRSTIDVEPLDGLLAGTLRRLDNAQPA